MKRGRTTELLAPLVQRYALNGHQAQRLADLLERLASDPTAPTSVTAPDRTLDVHLADSLVALEFERVRQARRIVDIGAGAGFPGLPLAVALPAARVWLLDGQARKCAFVQRAIRDVGIENAEAVCARAEEWREGIGAHDLALARAVAPQAVVLEYAAPLLELGGALADWRGLRVEDEERDALGAAEQLGLTRVEVRRVEPFEAAREHHLHLYVKTAKTPDRFPRRAGMARKRPLGLM